MILFLSILGFILLVGGAELLVRGSVRLAVERLVLLGRSSEAQFADAALPRLTSGSASHFSFAGSVQPMREVQNRYARWALSECGNNKSRTAERLEIDVKTLAKYLSNDSPE